MVNNFKIKISDEDPSRLLLALLLLKKGLKVEIINTSNIEKTCKQEKFFLISSSTKLLLDELNLWIKLKDKAYSIESISITDILIFEKLDFSYRDRNLNKAISNNILWILSYSDLYEILIKELSTFNDVFNKLNVNIKSDKLNSSNLKLPIYEFLNKRFFITLLDNNYTSIEFKVSLRGNIERRLYSTISENGIVILFPVNKNLFSIKWIIKDSIEESRIGNEKNLLLDNLSTILPKELKIDQIFGDLNIIPLNKDFKKSYKAVNNLINKKGSINILDLRLDGVNLSFRDVIYIYDNVINNRFNDFILIRFLKFKLLVNKRFKLLIKFCFYQLIIIDNYFINSFKKIIFYLLKKVTILRRLCFKLFFLIF
tara:strand:- start:131 stop:1240 length:1110 start_codon:yes stop_codon:yes gene_type:complete